MLVLTRKSHEQIQIGDNITITILRVKGGAVRVGVDAPRNVTVLRKELAGKPAKCETQVEAVGTSAMLAVAAPALCRRMTEGTASTLAGGKTTTLADCLATNPKRPRSHRTAAPLGSFLSRK